MCPHSNYARHPASGALLPSLKKEIHATRRYGRAAGKLTQRFSLPWQLS